MGWGCSQQLLQCLLLTTSSLVSKVLLDDLAVTFLLLLKETIAWLCSSRLQVLHLGLTIPFKSSTFHTPLLDGKDCEEGAAAFDW